MRPATDGDIGPIADLIRARADWMREREIEGWDGWRENADMLAGQAGISDIPVWVLVHTAAATIAGVTSVFENTPSLGWPDEAERAESALFLATTVTDPSYARHKPGSLIAWWALHQAALQGRSWVRRGTGPFPGLVAYYETQGWQVVRTFQQSGVTGYALARRAEPQPHLPALGMRLN
ncbi:GNAT family N-acetyltransferase [Streptosporangium sp. NBC_01810]|uniref:GNAT family N-acetyltransferase n=1 Tax=Streptosporangium sp. NBC_01810 TaxID=2975951 RepID=UPI002DDB7639|nr:GNAT family N-acetyltransferase [Streptosporangium sp. NBC_01810]